MNIYALSALALASLAVVNPANAITYSVRQANGVSQTYNLDVPPGVEPAKSGALPGMPYSANFRMSSGAASVEAVGWAGGLSKDKSVKADPYLNSMTQLGADQPGGFYGASYIKVDSVQYITSPTPYYLVTMNGKVGDSRQTFYAAVLEDGRVIRPVPVSAAAERPRPMKKGRHGAWGGSKEKGQWGGSKEKGQWGGAKHGKKWGGDQSH